jgi:hypothetical protein
MIEDVLHNARRMQTAPEACEHNAVVVNGVLSGVVSSGNDCVEEEVNCGDPAIASNDKVGSGIGRCLARPA